MNTKPVNFLRLMSLGVLVLFAAGVMIVDCAQATEYDETFLRGILGEPVQGDIYLILTKHLIAAKLNLLAHPELSFFTFPDGSSIEDVTLQAEPYVDAYLSGLIADPEQDREIIEGLKDKLDTFNNEACMGTTCACTPGYWKQDKHIWPLAPDYPFLEIGDGGGGEAA
jgi:hypothetical protein